MSILPADLLGRYALFLESFRGRYGLAEQYYRRALAVDPNHARNRGRYAVFLETVRRDYDRAEAEYRRALEIDPENPVLLGNYADFLEQVRNDWDEAERYYRTALAVSPDHPNNLTNYATFLTEVRGKHDRAETLYQQALDVAPYHRNALFKYAIFLTDVRQDLTGAEELYERGLQVAPGNPAMQANYAGLLLLEGKRDEGLTVLGQALHHPALQAPSADAAECRFYALVHGAPEGRRVALQALRRLLEAGIRSPGFHLEPHVTMAVTAGHPWGACLEPLSRVLTGDRPTESLDAWEEWRAASPGEVH